MFARFHFRFIVLAALCCGISALIQAGEPEPATPSGQHGRGNPLMFALKHAADLGLTDEQKGKLDAAEKEAKSSDGPPDPQARAAMKQQIEAILTKEQLAVLKDLQQQARAASNSKDSDSAPPAPPPSRPEIEDNLRADDILNFIQTNGQRLFLREDQKKQLVALTPLTKNSTDEKSEKDLKKKMWDILSGQQIGNLREMLTLREDERQKSAPKSSK